MLPYYYYLVLEGFALIVCLLIHQNLNKKHSPMPDETVFLYLIFSNMAILCTDMLTWFIDGHIFPLSNLLLTWSNVIYYMLSSIILFLWLLYVSLRLSKKRRKTWVLIAVLLPVLFELVMSITAPINGLYFYVDSACVYHRGPLCWTQAYIGIAYMLLSAVYSLVHGLQARDLRVRSESFMLVAFTVFPLLQHRAVAVLRPAADLDRNHHFLYDVLYQDAKQPDFD